jgi:hypothetical protein
MSIGAVDGSSWIIAMPRSTIGEGKSGVIVWLVALELFLSSELEDSSSLSGKFSTLLIMNCVCANPRCAG